MSMNTVFDLKKQKNLATKKAIFLDFDYDLTISPSTNDFIMKKDSRAIIQALKILIMSNVTEFLMSDIFMGGDIQKLLFSNATNLVLFDLKQRIENTILKYEPRIELISVEVDQLDNNPNAVQITIVFRFTNIEEPVIEKIVIDRAR